jgi:hypothetical protein
VLGTRSSWCFIQQKVNDFVFEFHRRNAASAMAVAVAIAATFGACSIGFPA